MDESSADLTVAQVQRILNLFPGVRRVVLHGIGEPLLNAELPTIIRLVKSHGAHVLFNTNGLLLHGRVAREIAASGLDELRVSIDAGSPEIYEKVRGANGFDRIVENLRAFTEHTRDLAHDTPAVSLWLTGMKTNVGEITALVQLAHDVSVREVYLQRLVYSERGLAAEREALHGRAASEDLDEIRRAAALAEELGVALRGSGEATSSTVLGGEPQTYKDCRRPWTLMYVTANGNVLPCCIAPFTGAPYGELVLGNILSEAPETIWNGPRYQAWRRSMTSDTPPAACAGCGVGWSL
jgi:MoaA/NifB/PqqE/SkfB family radical SAM enzyme